MPSRQGLKLLLLVISFWGLSIRAEDDLGAKTIKDWEAQVQKHGETLKQACGVDIPTKFDGAEFYKAKFKNASEICQTGQWAVKNACDNRKTKELVLKKIKSINCKPGMGGDHLFGINDQEFNFTVGPDAKNISQKAVQFLKGALNHP